MPPRRFFLLLVYATTILFPLCAVAKTKPSPSALIAAGDQFRQNQRYKDAIDQYGKAIKLDKRHAKTYQYRADCELILGDYKRAVADAGKSIKLNPQDPDAFSLRARAYDQLKEYKQEKADLDRLITLQPNGSNLLLRAQTNLRLKDYAPVINDCNNAINSGLSRPELAQLYHLRSDAYKKLGKKREYEEELAKYNSLQP